MEGGQGHRDAQGDHSVATYRSFLLSVLRAIYTDWKVTEIFLRWKIRNLSSVENPNFLLSSLVTASLDGSLIVWDVSSGQQVQSYTHPDRIGFRMVRVSPDGIIIVASMTHLQLK